MEKKKLIVGVVLLSNMGAKGNPQPYWRKDETPENGAKRTGNPEFANCKTTFQTASEKNRKKKKDEQAKRRRYTPPPAKTDHRGG